MPRPLPWSDPLCRLLGGAAQGASREDDLLLAVDRMARSGRRVAAFRRLAEVERREAERLAAELADAEEVLPEAAELVKAQAGPVLGAERAEASSSALVERAVSKFLNVWILPNHRCGREQRAALGTDGGYLHGKLGLWCACRDGHRVVSCSTACVQNAICLHKGQPGSTSQMRCSRCQRRPATESIAFVVPCLAVATRT